MLISRCANDQSGEGREGPEKEIDYTVVYLSQISYLKTSTTVAISLHTVGTKSSWHRRCFRVVYDMKHCDHETANWHLAFSKSAIQEHLNAPATQAVKPEADDKLIKLMQNCVGFVVS